MRYLRILLQQLIGVTGYLHVISKTYILLILAGQLQRQYPEIHHLRDIVKEGDVCLDIGANLGYYTVMLSRITGPEGRVLAVEPVKEFNKILDANCSLFGLQNIDLFPYALGEKHTTVEMATPEVEGVFRHGLTKVVNEGDKTPSDKYDVAMRTPNELFGNLPSLDYIKCDVEGYEEHFFENLIDHIEKHQPIIQIELNSESNRHLVWSLLSRVGYAPHQLSHGSLRPLSDEKYLNYSDGDFYFLPKTKVTRKIAFG